MRPTESIHTRAGIMSKKKEIKEPWTCPKCGRQFERKGQPHSCKSFPLEQHFKRKPAGTLLYEKFRQKVEKEVGSFRIESLECCIHFVKAFNFTSVKIFQDKIDVHFTLSNKLKSKRIKRHTQMSARRHLYSILIEKEEDIDEELIGWIGEAYGDGITYN